MLTIPNIFLTHLSANLAALRHQQLATLAVVRSHTLRYSRYKTATAAT